MINLALFIGGLAWMGLGLLFGLLALASPDLALVLAMMLSVLCVLAGISASWGAIRPAVKRAREVEDDDSRGA